MLFTLASTVDGVITTDLHHQVKFINKAGSELTGWSLQEAVGQPLESVFRLAETSGVPMELPLVKEWADTGVSSAGLKRNTTLLDKHGGRKYISASVSEIKNNEDVSSGIVIIFRDISRLRKVEEDLLTERNNFKMFFNYAPLGMLIVDRGFNILQSNELVNHMAAIPGNPVWHLDDLFLCVCTATDSEDSAERVPCTTCRLKSMLERWFDTLPEKNVQLPLPLAQEGGKDVRWFRVGAVPLTMQQEQVLMLTLDDVTESKRAEEELIRARELAEAADRAKGQFLANMSHEIRTPLNGMLGMIELTLKKELSGEQRENLIIAKQSADSLLTVINDILDFSKIEAGKLTIEHVGFDLRTLLEKTLKSHRRFAVDKGLDLQLTVESDVPPLMFGDPVRIQQVINNLVGNAIKFTQTGSIRIRVAQYSASDTDVTLLFKVSDTGIGIDEQEKHLLFQSFSQVDGSFTRRFGGTGLGLAISKQLVEMMGGSIWAKGEKGKGSSFYFTIRFSLQDDISTGKGGSSAPLALPLPMPAPAEPVQEGDKQSVMDRIAESIEELKSVVDGESFAGLEAKAHRIKELSLLIEAVTLKNCAFKIELAARRGSRNDVIGHADALEQIFQRMVEGGAV